MLTHWGRKDLVHASNTGWDPDNYSHPVQWPGYQETDWREVYKGHPCYTSGEWERMFRAWAQGDWGEMAVQMNPAECWVSVRWCVQTGHISLLRSASSTWISISHILLGQNQPPLWPHLSRQVSTLSCPCSRPLTNTRDRRCSALRRWSGTFSCTSGATRASGGTRGTRGGSDKSTSGSPDDFQNVLT